MLQTDIFSFLIPCFNPTQTCKSNYHLKALSFTRYMSHYSLPSLHLLLVYSTRILQFSKQSIVSQAICPDSQLTPSLSPYLLLINKQVQYKINCFPRPTFCFFPAATRSSHNQFLFNQVTNQQYHLAVCFDYSLQKMAIPRKYVSKIDHILLLFTIILFFYKASSQAGYKLNMYKYCK